MVKKEYIHKWVRYSTITIVSISILLSGCTDNKLNDEQVIKIGEITHEVSNNLLNIELSDCEKLAKTKSYLVELESIDSSDQLYQNAKNNILLTIGQYKKNCEAEKVIEAKKQSELEAYQREFRPQLLYRYVKEVITNGSNRNLLGNEIPMPDKYGLVNLNSSALISDSEIETVSLYIANDMNGAGAEVFDGTCAACHGVDGEGFDYVAPSLKNIKLPKNYW